MNDNDLKKCMRDISDDLVKEADLSVTGAASARTPNPNPRKNNILEIAAAAVLVAALSAVVIYKIVDKNRRSNEPSSTDIISTLTTPSPEAPTATERPSATELTTDREPDRNADSGAGHHRSFVHRPAGLQNIRLQFRQRTGRGAEFKGRSIF